MKIKAVLFDADDTLLDYAKKATGWHISAAKKLRLRIPEREEFKQSWGLPWDAMIRKLWPGANVEEFKGTYKELTKGRKIKQVKGAKEVLKKLKKQKIVLGIVTGRDMESLKRRFGEAGIPQHWFELTITSDSNPFQKPDPLVLSQALGFLKRENIKQSEAIFVGDTLIDAQTSGSTKINFVGVLTGCFSETEFRKAGIKNIICSIRELPAFIEAFSGQKQPSARHKSGEVKLLTCLQEL